MTASPTQLSLRHLRGQGWTAAITEVWNPHAGIRQDLFGFIDVLAVRDDQTLAVQTTTAHNALARVRKIADSEHIAAIRKAGWSIHVHGWEKVSGRWTLKREIDVS